MGRGRVTARQLWVAAESVHAVTYFAPACRQAVRDVGLKGFWVGYFATRAAPLGAVGAGPVTAAFFNFHPIMVRKAVPACWEAVDPEELTVLRAAAASEALVDLCGPDLLNDMSGALPLLRTAAGRCAGEGRVMTGANRELWPLLEAGLQRRGLPTLHMAAGEVWQACTTLREHRGDGHVAALLTHGLSGLEAHVLATGTQGLATEMLRENRGWTEEEWEGGVTKMAERGLLHPDGRATESGHALRRSVEAMTDDLAEQPLTALSDVEVGILYRSLYGCAAQIQGSGVFPFPNPMGLPELAGEAELVDEPDEPDEADEADEPDEAGVAGVAVLRELGGETEA